MRVLGGMRMVVLLTFRAQGCELVDLGMLGRGL